MMRSDNVKTGSERQRRGDSSFPGSTIFSILP
jgi:hypothetical protein